MSRKPTDPSGTPAGMTLRQLRAVVMRDASNTGHPDIDKHLDQTLAEIEAEFGSARGFCQHLERLSAREDAQTLALAFHNAGQRRGLT